LYRCYITYVQRFETQKERINTQMHKNPPLLRRFLTYDSYELLLEIKYLNNICFSGTQP
jgi:hypothetical protein